MTDDFDVEVPPFFCPIDPVMHPDMDLVARRSGEWATSVGLVRDGTELTRWLASTSADFYGGMVPNADTDHYQAAADWVYWGFYFDDAHCDEGDNATLPNRFTLLMGRLQRMLETGDERLCGGDRYLLGLCDLAHRYQKLATPTQYERWLTAHRRWLFGVVQQITCRSLGRPLTLDDYLLIRLSDCGGLPTQAMFEFANTAEIPGREFDSPAVRAITELFCLIAALDNDRTSRYKEVRGQHGHYNAVDVLVHELSVPEPEAEATLIRLRDRMMVLLLRMREWLSRTASEPLGLYLEALGHGIRSNIDWSLRTPRYAVDASGDKRPDGARMRLRSHCTDRPTDSRPEPPPLSSVASWWSHLS
jgi:hypothetical protein